MKETWGAGAPQVVESANLGQIRKSERAIGQSALPSIVLKNSFWGDERNFLELLIRIERGDVRDHIDLSKIDHGPW
jgi:hypothetical protein